MALGDTRHLATRIRAGHPAHEILAAAEACHVGLIVLGRSGHSRLWGRLIGSTTERVSRRAHCSVLIVDEGRLHTTMTSVTPGQDHPGPPMPTDAGFTLAREQDEQQARDVFAVRPARHRARTAVILAVIGLGGGLGSSARYLLAQALPTPAGGFPWATFVTNVAGCLLLGALMVFVLEVWPAGRYVRPFLGVGVLGGFTTFSAYTSEIVHLAQGGHWAPAGSYALDSLVAGLVAVWCGMAAARRLTRTRRTRQAGGTA
ncbi:fluoride efflux transporter CrcB [Nonomuraea fastidiosa]|uniref:fluoride efflux transporter CrcB n=1 Tax=Nonomuraea TaxID=83681 RepID=UPI00324321C3